MQAYDLEFLGRSTFVPGLWLAGLGFFGVNCWILQIIVGDIGKKPILKADGEGIVREWSEKKAKAS